MENRRQLLGSHPRGWGRLASETRGPVNAVKSSGKGKGAVEKVPGSLVARLHDAHARNGVTLTATPLRKKSQTFHAVVDETLFGCCNGGSTSRVV